MTLFKKNRRKFIKKLTTLSLFSLVIKKTSIVKIFKEKVFKRKFSKVWILNKNDY